MLTTPTPSQETKRTYTLYNKSIEDKRNGEKHISN